MLSLILSSVLTLDTVSADGTWDENLWKEEMKNMEWIDEKIVMEKSQKYMFLYGIRSRQEGLTVYGKEKWNQLSETENAQFDISQYLKAVDVDKEFEAMATLEMFFVPEIWQDRNAPWEIGGVSSDNIMMVRPKQEHVFRLVHAPLDEDKIEELKRRLESYYRTVEGYYAAYSDGSGSSWTIVSALR